MNTGNKQFSNDYQDYFDVKTLATDKTITTIEDVPGLVISKPLISGVYYRWCFSSYVNKTTTATLTVSITDENNVAIADRAQTMITGEVYAFMFDFYELGNGVQVTRKIRVSNASGSSVIRSGAFPSQFSFTRMT